MVQWGKSFLFGRLGDATLAWISCRRWCLTRHQSSLCFTHIEPLALKIDLQCLITTRPEWDLHSELTPIAKHQGMDIDKG
jgi:hypothetical protein